eukprot:PLAT2440.1.p1 GENE.PLAT2440.1~~PLAT2440.1.p1  ORF type:complete len:290 (-),score=106.39 PLAT2440.1:74-817(-)
MNRAFWREYRLLFNKLALRSDVRAIVVTAQGKHFSAGLDLKEEQEVAMAGGDDDKDVARIARSLRTRVMEMQDAFTAMERCPQPVIVAVHGACIGGAVDLISAADIRLASEDAFFSIKEVDVGLAADVGSLARLPLICGNESLLRELAFTARRFGGEEALRLGLLSRVLPTRDDLYSEAVELAAVLAAKSPVALSGTKHNLLWARGKSVEAALEYIATWNASQLQTDDLGAAVMAHMAKMTPTFSKL